MNAPQISNSDVPDTWLESVRNLQNQGIQFRPCPVLPRIQSRRSAEDLWSVQMLPTSATEFVSVEERDAAWARLLALPS